MAIDNASLDGAVREIGDRWSLRLIGALLDGDRTFSELSEEVAGIAPNILTARLKALQRDALVGQQSADSRVAFQCRRFVVVAAENGLHAERASQARQFFERRAVANQQPGAGDSEATQSG